MSDKSEKTMGYTTLAGDLYVIDQQPDFMLSMEGDLAVPDLTEMHQKLGALFSKLLEKSRVAVPSTKTSEPVNIQSLWPNHCLIGIGDPLAADTPHADGLTNMPPIFLGDGDLFPSGAYREVMKERRLGILRYMKVHNLYEERYSVLQVPLPDVNFTPKVDPHAPHSKRPMSAVEWAGKRPPTHPRKGKGSSARTRHQAFQSRQRRG